MLVWHSIVIQSVFMSLGSYLEDDLKFRIEISL